MIDLDELARLDAERTQGEWATYEHREVGTCRLFSRGVPGDIAATIMGGDEGISNSEVIVGAVNALGPLLRAVRAAKRVRDWERSHGTLREGSWYTEGAEAKDELDEALKCLTTDSLWLQCAPWKRC